MFTGLIQGFYNGARHGSVSGNSSWWSPFPAQFDCLWDSRVDIYRSDTSCWCTWGVGGTRLDSDAGVPVIILHLLTSVAGRIDFQYTDGSLGWIKTICDDGDEDVNKTIPVFSPDIYSNVLTFVGSPPSYRGWRCWNIKVAMCVEDTADVCYGRLYAGEAGC